MNNKEEIPRLRGIDFSKENPNTGTKINKYRMIFFMILHLFIKISSLKNTIFFISLQKKSKKDFNPDNTNIIQKLFIPFK